MKWNFFEPNEAVGLLPEHKAWCAHLAAGGPCTWGCGNFWLLSSKLIKRQIVQSMSFSFWGSIAGIGATLAGMEIIRGERTLTGSLLFAGLFFLGNLIWLLTSYRADLARRDVFTVLSAALSSEVMRKIPALSSRAEKRFSSGYLKSLVSTDVDAVCNFADNFTRNVVPACVNILILTPMAWSLAGIAGLIGMLAACSQIVVSIFLATMAGRMQGVVVVRRDELTTLISEWIRNIRMVKFLSWQNVITSQIADAVRRMLRAGIGEHLFVCLTFGTTMTWWMVSTATMVFAAKALELPVDSVRVFGVSWLIILTSRYLAFVANSIRLFVEARPSAKRLETLLAAEERTVELHVGKPLLSNTALPVAFYLEKVSVIIDEKIVLSSLTCRLPFSDRIALIGRIGSGKSTIIRLLAGLIPPTSGSIFVEFTNGERRNFWEADCYRNVRAQLGWVPQEPFVANDLLGANICLDDLWHSADAWHAAMCAELSSDIDSFPEKFETEIGESGINLSGGQRQRLNMARAFYANRPFLLLDDPLSAVDRTTEVKLMDRLLSLPGGFLLVSHRLAELSRVDRILVLEEGKIVEDDQPNVLLTQKSSHFMQVLKAYETKEVPQP